MPIVEEWFCPECDQEVVDRRMRGTHLAACRRTLRAQGVEIPLASETGHVVPKNKFCEDCGETKPYEPPHWYIDQRVCAACFREASNQRYEEDAAFNESAKERSKRWREDNPERFKEQGIRRRQEHSEELEAYFLWLFYHKTPAERDALLATNGGGCWICGQLEPSGKALAMDHDHRCCPGRKTCGKCFRGLLCAHHNQAIGKFSDSPALMRRAIAYLEYHNVLLWGSPDGPESQPEGPGDEVFWALT